MNKPTPFGKQTFAEYEKEVKDFKAFNLKAEKVELGLSDDAKKILKEGDKIISEIKKTEQIAKSLGKKADSQWKKSNKIYDEAKKLYEEFNKKAKELGVDLPKEIDSLWTNNVDLARYNRIAFDIADGVKS